MSRVRPAPRRREFDAVESTLELTPIVQHDLEVVFRPPWIDAEQSPSDPRRVVSSGRTDILLASCRRQASPWVWPPVPRPVVGGTSDVLSD